MQDIEYITREEGEQFSLKPSNTFKSDFDNIDGIETIRIMIFNKDNAIALISIDSSNFRRK